MKGYAKAIFGGVSTFVATLAVAAESNGVSLAEVLTALSAALAAAGAVAWVKNAPSD